METATSPAETRARVASRRWCIPPAIERDPGCMLEGFHVLEGSPGDFGLLLWRIVRDVGLWADTPSGLRDELFQPGSRLALLTAAELPASITEAVDTLHGMLTLGSRSDPEVVTVCCLRVAAWACAAGLAHTAVAFAQAGARVVPMFSEAAVHVGMYAAATGQRERARTWFRRAVTLARREQNRPAYVAVLVELGVLHEANGNQAQAVRHFRWAFGAARRYSARRERMRAAHGLFRLALLRGDHDAAAHHAASAQRAYDPGARDGQRLLLDLGRFWLDRGEARKARSALRRLWKGGLDGLSPADRLAGFAMTARASAEGGYQDRSAAVVQLAWDSLSDDGITDPARLAAAEDLAHAARAAGDAVEFRRASRLVQRLAPPDVYEAAAARMRRLWPELPPLVPSDLSLRCAS